MDDMKTHEWCAAYPHAAAEEIKRLNAKLSEADAAYAAQSREVSKLQDACRECAAVANKVASDLATVHAMLKEKGL